MMVAFFRCSLTTILGSLADLKAVANGDGKRARQHNGQRNGRGKQQMDAAILCTYAELDTDSLDMPVTGSREKQPSTVVVQSCTHGRRVH